jgi:hypothetical protein
VGHRPPIRNFTTGVIAQFRPVVMLHSLKLAVAEEGYSLFREALVKIATRPLVSERAFRTGEVIASTPIAGVVGIANCRI